MQSETGLIGLREIRIPASAVIGDGGLAETAAPNSIGGRITPRAAGAVDGLRRATCFRA